MRVQLAQAPTDGGFACLRMLFASHGVHVGAEQLREVSGVGRDSPNLDTVNSTAQWFGFETELRDIREFLGAHEHEALEFPMIAEWGATKARQFIVVTQVDAKSIQLIDPFVGRRTVDRLEAGRSLSGRVLSITADPDRSTFTQVPATNTLKLFVTSKSGAAFVILAGLGLIVPGIIAPGLVRIFVDDFLARGDRDSQKHDLGRVIRHAGRVNNPDRFSTKCNEAAQHYCCHRTGCANYVAFIKNAGVVLVIP